MTHGLENPFVEKDTGHERQQTPPVLLEVRWKITNSVRTVRRIVCRRLYRDPGSDVSDCVIVAGSGRSGTTWLAEIISEECRSRLMFEPFNPRKIPEYKKFAYFQYMRPEDYDDDLHNYCQQLLSGRLRNLWIDRGVTRLFPRNRVIKTIRATGMLKWMSMRFPTTPIVYIIRNPCAVVASRIQRRWDTDKDLASFLHQPKFVDDYVSPERLSLIERSGSEAQKHAIVWCLQVLVPLTQMQKSDCCFVFYEDLIRDPGAESKRIFSYLNKPVDASVISRVAKPSSTTKSTSAIRTGADMLSAWREVLSTNDAADVHAVVRAFGLDYLYGDLDVPRIQSAKLPGHKEDEHVAGP